MANLPNIPGHALKKGSSFLKRTVMAIVLLALMAVLAVIIYAVVKIRCDLDNLNQGRVDGGMERVKRNSRGFESNILPGLEAIQLSGTISALQVVTNGTIGPWYVQNTNIDSVQLEGYYLTIVHSGIYFVYAQLYYLTTEPSNSFEIVKSRQHHTDETLTTCAKHWQPPTDPSKKNSEVSCFTGIISTLESGDRLSLYQIEKKRIISLTPGFSHWGLVKLQDTRNAL